MVEAGYDVEFVELNVEHSGAIDPASAGGVVDAVVEFVEGVPR
jgi:hypothetical protein